MVSTKLMIFMLVITISIAISSIFERNWVRFIYWTGASLINLAVIKM